MNDCHKCGERPYTRANYCNLCRWLLKLGGAVKPTNWASLGLPEGNDFDLRQEAETMPYARNVATWYEVN